MDLSFNKVNYDGDLEDADEEQLRSLIQNYEDAQDANAAEFKAAKEKLEEVGDVNVEEFHDACDNLREEIKEFDAFDGQPLVSEDDLEAADFGQLKEYKAYFAELDASSDSESDGDSDGDGEFTDFGTKSEKPDEEAEDKQLADEFLGDMPGVTF